MFTPTKSRSWWKGMLRLAATLAVLALLFVFLPLGQLGAALGRIPPGLWLIVLAGYAAVHVVGVVKWRMMVNLAGAELSPRQAVQCYASGLFGTLFLPSIVGGDVLRLGLALRFARNREGAALASLLDRVLDLTALAAVAAFGAALLPRALDQDSERVFWIVAAGLAVLIAGSTAVLWLTPARHFPHRWRRNMVRLRQALRSMSRQRRFVLLALGMGIVIQTSFALLCVVIAKGCGLFVPVSGWLVAWPLAKLSSLLPITQGGIGVREVALAALLAPFDAPAVLSVAVGLVWEAIVVVGGLIAGLIAFLLGRRAQAPRRAVPVAEAPAEPDQVVLPRS